KNTLIMDAYNANPSSVEVAIENLLTMEANKKFFILGDMLELGEESEKEHICIYNLIKDNNLNGIFVGPEFQKAFKEKEGLKSFASTKEAIDEISKMELSDLLILLKGSRGMRLETICPAL
ncbi:MAG: UDP-N-acetylmuramoyl-tripeptide--D-alanyl-D-alanine ligase, partial [Urechidicola sp.]